MNSLCDNSDAYILLTGNIAAKNANDANLAGWGGGLGVKDLFIGTNTKWLKRDHHMMQMQA